MAATIAALDPSLLRERALPAALGPITAGLVLGGTPALTAFFHDDARPDINYHVPNSAIELLLVAAALGALALFEGLRGRTAAE